jgi:hypothetical protein
MNLELQRVAYRSDATRPDFALQLLAEILSVSDRNNRRDGLTGVLVVGEGRFFQVLEGVSQDLDRTLARIGADPRHTGIQVVLRTSIRERMFSDWGMAATRITPLRKPRIDDVVASCDVAPERAIMSARHLLEEQRRP